MIDSSDLETSDADRPSIQFSPQPDSPSDGPVTVLNQGPPRPGDGNLAVPTDTVESELQRRLFPSHSSHDFIAPFDPGGIQLDHIRIEQVIGRGGMGAVFRATDQRLDRVVALKVLSPTFSRDPATVERFRNEAKSAARLDHDNVARVFYSGQDRGLHFIAFEFVTGTNLRDLILREGRLDPDEAVNYTLQIAAALRHTAANGVVHRDIKPSNIIITPSGRAKLVDLGLARKESTETSADLTVAGTTLGTFDYISPEQARDPREVDVRSDIYSLGCTLYHMLTGEPPYPDGNFVQKLLERQDRSPPDPAVKAPKVGPELSAVVQRMMAPRPRRRYPDADELLNDLMQVAGRMGLRGVPPEGLVWAPGSKLQKNRLWERHLGWMVTAGLLILAVFGIDFFSRTHESGDPSGAIVGGPVNRTSAKPVQNASGNVAKTTPSDGAVQPKVPSDGVRNALPITLHELEPDSWPVLPHAVGLLGAHGVAWYMNELDPRGDDALTRVFPSQAARSKTGRPPKTGGAPTKVAAETKSIAILTAAGEPGKSFPSLEAAAADADDGDVVVLRFNGVRRSGGKPVTDKPLLVRDKSITIRAAAGFHPAIRFAGAKVPSSDPQTRMITVLDSSLSVIGVHFELRVDDALDADNEARWTLFSLQGSDRVRLRGVRIRVHNPQTQSASAFEISPKAGPNLAKMKMMKKKAGTDLRDRFEIKIDDSSVHGECDLLAAVNPRPGSLEIQNSAMVVGGSVLMVHADEPVEMLPEGDHIDLKLEHVTALTGRSLIDVSAENVAAVLPVWTSARNNLFRTLGEKPFVTMTGAGQVSDFREVLKWEGENNFYDRFKSMWMIDTSDAEAQPATLTFDGWREKNQDVKARRGGVIWKTDWTGADLADISFSALKLDDSVGVTENPAATGATDGTAVGADLDRLPKAPDASVRP
ncbi:MAG: serine/threonine-protein kinase [Planctomycetaceae bacterium]